jgi:hypothetical protein
MTTMPLAPSAGGASRRRPLGRPPFRGAKVASYLHRIRQAFHQTTSTAPSLCPSNLTRDEASALRSLSKRSDIVIKSADKGSAIVVMDRADYVRACHLLLHTT